MKLATLINWKSTSPFIHKWTAIDLPSRFYYSSSLSLHIHNFCNTKTKEMMKKKRDVEQAAKNTRQQPKSNHVKHSFCLWIFQIIVWMTMFLFLLMILWRFCGLRSGGRDEISWSHVKWCRNRVMIWNVNVKSLEVVLQSTRVPCVNDVTSKVNQSHIFT